MGAGFASDRGVVVAVVGPTASGKTELAIEIARQLNTEIVSADARQVFKGMAIGTAQPTQEERQAVLHHLVDFLDPTELYSAGSFERDAVPILDELCREKGAAVLAGGSGMYIKAALEGLDSLPADMEIRRQLNVDLENLGLGHLVKQLEQLDPEHAQRMDTSNPQRVVRALEVCLASGQPFSSFHTSKKRRRNWHVVKVGLDPDRGELRERIATRAQHMLDLGWLQETHALLPFRASNALNTVGYKELFQHIDGDVSLDEALALTVTHTRQFAKRQMTWFRKDAHTIWFPYTAESRSATLKEAAAFAIQEVQRLQDTPFESDAP